MFTQSKICSKCKILKLLSEFYKHKKHKHGVSSACKECTRKQFNISYHTRPNQKINNIKYRNSLRGKKTRQGYVQTSGYKFNRRKYWLKGAYSLTPKQYNQILQSQNGVCRICGRLETSNNQYGLMRLAVDHNHKTGKVRGLLCQRCNQALGLTNENAETLQRMIDYINI